MTSTARCSCWPPMPAPTSPARCCLSMAGMRSAPSDMALGEATTRDRLAQFLCGAAGARAVEIVELRRLSGGTGQENWLLVAAIEDGAFAGRQKLVVRTDAATSLSMSRDRATEFAVQRLVHAGGVTVPEPLFLCRDAAVIGKPFFVMRWMPGAADGQRIVAGELGGARELLAERLAQELATLHKFRPPRDALAGLGAPPPHGAGALLGGHGGVALARHRARAARPLSALGRTLAAIAAQRAPPRGMRTRDPHADRAGGRGGVMRDRPDAASLLDFARIALLRDLTPPFPAERPYEANLIARAIAGCPRLNPS